jgi:16S rRNA processing protein RimM
MPQADKILVGVIVGAHGIKGQVRLRTLTDQPEAIAKYKPLQDAAGRDYGIKLVGVARDALIASIKGVTDRNGAEALQGVELFVPRTALPKAKRNEYYASDLIGLTAQDESGKLIGTVQALHDFGGGPILEIAPSQGKNFMLPFKDAFVPEVNLVQGLVIVSIPEGWLV